MPNGTGSSVVFLSAICYLRCLAGSFYNWVVAEGLSPPIVPMQALRVFLVENHEDTVRYIKMYLEHLGHEVLIAPEMQTALREIPESKSDVLISDIGLPEGDGWSLLERLGPSRPAFAIAISGYGTGNDQRKSRAVGYNAHLVKPFLPNALLALLQQAAEKRESTPANQAAQTRTDAKSV
jgi:CheY-like chemotaxis protein